MSNNNYAQSLVNLSINSTSLDNDLNITKTGQLLPGHLIIRG